MIKENNMLREQMTPFNRSYMEDMIIAMRASRVEAQRAEELLLQAAKDLLQAQKKGRNAKQVFGEHPEDHFKEIMDSAPPRAGRSRLNFILMIPWAALTCLFGALAIAGLISQWTTGSPGIFGQISLFTLLVIALGSIIVIEVIMKWLGSLSDTDNPAIGKFEFRALGVYIGIAVVIVFAGRYLGELFPLIPLSPWVSLGIFICGLIGLKFFFMKK
ncbi:DUF1129 family protein [Paenibacillus sp. sgz500958]|uniref:DUF1129 family protein n=1 Tax=Paenibacillus sp. sgz500958 TaxID=3242475 RepID=UPI0036D42D79